MDWKDRLKGSGVWHTIVGALLLGYTLISSALAQGGYTLPTTKSDWLKTIGLAAYLAFAKGGAPLARP